MPINTRLGNKSETFGHLPKAFWTPFRRPPCIFQIPSTHLPDIFHKSSRDHLDSLQSTFRHPPNIPKTPQTKQSKKNCESHYSRERQQFCCKFLQVTWAFLSYIQLSRAKLGYLSYHRLSCLTSSYNGLSLSILGYLMLLFQLTVSKNILHYSNKHNLTISNNIQPYSLAISNRN